MQLKFAQLVLNILCLTARTSGYISAANRNAFYHLYKDNARLSAAVNETKTTDLLTSCAHFCLARCFCNRFNYNPLKRLCEILSGSQHDFGAEQLQPVIGWQHYVVKEVTGNCLSLTGSELCSPMQVCRPNESFSYKCHDLANIAFGKAAIQSSTHEIAYASRAVDGNAATDFFFDSCTHTNYSAGQWWMVDLGKPASVQSVKITNRGDCCGSRLGNFNIRIGDSNIGNGDANAACAVNESVAEGASKIIKCRPSLCGRYLYVQQNIADALTICEIEVYGELL